MIKIAFLLFFASSAYAAFLPYDVEVEEKNYITRHTNKKMVKKVIRKLKKEFFKDATKRFAKISINDVWWSTTFNAYAMKYGPIWKITVHGGLVKHKDLKESSLALVLCHELGHFLGGSPKFPNFGRRWSSYEGQADYWTGQKCLKRYFREDNNIEIVKTMEIDPLARLECDSVYRTENKRALCYRVSMAALDMAKLVASITGKTEAALHTPDMNTVDTTYPDHPNFQCRVDTYFQASLCSEKGPCLEGGVGTRPLCWYAAK